MIVFLVFLAIEQAQLNDAPELYFLIAIPFILLFSELILLVRAVGPAAKMNYDAMEADDGWTAFLVGSVFVRPVVTAYRKGFMITSRFEDVHKSYNALAFKAATYSNRTMWSANTLPTIAAAIIMAVVGPAVAQGKMGLSAFVVFMSTINAFGPALGAIFGDLFTISKGHAGIQKLASLLNCDTRRKQMRRGQERREKLLVDYKNHLERNGEVFAKDNLIIHNLSHEFDPQAEAASMKLPLFANIEGCQVCLRAPVVASRALHIHRSMPVSQVLAMRGIGNSEKNKTLRLIARHFVPTTGFIYYPSRSLCTSLIFFHNRVIYRFKAFSA
jgi:ABC-type multidrug transport system fused ATPase/permease subunit